MEKQRTKEEIIQAFTSGEREFSYEEMKIVFGEDYTLEEHYDFHPEQHPYARYIEQLVEDIQALIKDGPAHYFENDYDLDDDFDDLEDTDELWTQDSPELSENVRKITLEELFGIEQINFPPPDGLPADLIWKLSYAFEELLYSQEIHMVYPDDDLSELLYYWIHAAWNTKPIVYDELGSASVEICDKNPVQCSLKEYCSCLEKSDLDEPGGRPPGLDEPGLDEPGLDGSTEDKETHE